ncbi:hypothetical protein TNCV_4651841 [Trichonephila clavipes]|nr:hypothetical protein TNCV_4651841 [Trichonephila clavipes]
MGVEGWCFESTEEVKWDQVFLFHTGFSFMTNIVSLGDNFFFYCSLADFFGGIVPSGGVTSIPCSVDASATSSGRQTYDHRTLFL